MINKIIKKLMNKQSKEEATMEWCYKHGFKSGKNFLYYGYPIDTNWPWLISIGDNVTLATGVKILAHDASTALVCKKTKIGRTVIGNNVFIGYNSIVLCGITIGDNVVVGAGSVVTRNLDSNGVYAGNPARFICSIDEYKVKCQYGVESGETDFIRPWYDWKNASQEEYIDMQNKLIDKIGYI